MASSSSNTTTSQKCESGHCGTPDLPLWDCASCDSFYCATCWLLQGPHLKGKVGLDGLPHEKTDINVVNSLKAILEPPNNLAALRKLHEKDAATKWFGVESGDTPYPVTLNFPPVFRNYGRYATLIAETRPSNGTTRYPQLVSFIGQTSEFISTFFGSPTNKVRCWQKHIDKDAHL